MASRGGVFCWSRGMLPFMARPLLKAFPAYALFNASSFNQPLNNWDVSNVTNMTKMFSGARSFNQPLNKWNVSNVTRMAWMFQDATSFNQPLDNWNVSKVTYTWSMFSGAT